MASNNRQNVVLTLKSGNARTSSSSPKQKVKAMPQMSPEAQRALGMVQEDVKENLTSTVFDAGSSIAILDNDLQSNIGARLDNNNNNNNPDSGSSFRNSRNDTGRSRRNLSNNRVQRLHPRQGKGFLPKSVAANPARSRSTLSHTDPPFSTSDNTESCNQTTTASSASVYTNNNSACHSGNINNRSGKAAVNQVEDEDYDDADDENDDIGTYSNEQDFSNGNLFPAREKSFVIAFNKALERKAISRLKGDITDTSGIHQPGTVRALDGGRLANAQEVVVNVCHDDERQLVFHDEDEESLDTAKEISQIRVNIWMEYNSAFRPDNDIHDIQIPEIPEDLPPTKTATSATSNRQHADKTFAGSRRNLSSTDKKASGPKDSYGSKNKNNVNDKTNRGMPTTSLRPKTSLSNAKSGQSNSSGSQKGAPNSKRAPVNSWTRR